MKLIKISSFNDSTINKSIKNNFEKVDKSIRYLKISDSLIFAFSETDGYAVKIAKSIALQLIEFKKSETALILSLNSGNITVTYLNLVSLEIEAVMKDIEYNIGALLSVFENYRKENPSIFYIDSANLNQGIIDLSNMLEISEGFFHKIVEDDTFDFKFEKLKQSKYSLQRLKQKLNKDYFIDKKNNLANYILENKKKASLIIAGILLIIVGYFGITYYIDSSNESKRLERLEEEERIKKLLELKKERNKVSGKINNLFKNIYFVRFIDKNIENLEAIYNQGELIKLQYSSKTGDNVYSEESTVTKIKLSSDLYKVFETNTKKTLLGIKKFKPKDIRALNLDQKEDILLSDFHKNTENVLFEQHGVAWSYRKYSEIEDFKKDLKLLSIISDNSFSINLFKMGLGFEVKYTFSKN